MKVGLYTRAVVAASRNFSWTAGRLTIWNGLSAAERYHYLDKIGVRGCNLLWPKLDIFQPNLIHTKVAEFQRLYFMMGIDEPGAAQVVGSLNLTEQRQLCFSALRFFEERAKFFEALTVSGRNAFVNFIDSLECGYLYRDLKKIERLNLVGSLNGLNLGKMERSGQTEEHFQKYRELESAPEAGGRQSLASFVSILNGQQCFDLFQRMPSGGRPKFLSLVIAGEEPRLKSFFKFFGLENFTEWFPLLGMKEKIRLYQTFGAGELLQVSGFQMGYFGNEAGPELAALYASLSQAERSELLGFFYPNGLVNLFRSLDSLPLRTDLFLRLFDENLRPVLGYLLHTYERRLAELYRLLELAGQGKLFQLLDPNQKQRLLSQLDNAERQQLLASLPR